MKKCLFCKNNKEMSDFYVCKDTGYYSSKCKDCTKKNVKNRYNSFEGKIKIRKYEYKRARDKNRKNKHKIYQQNWINKNKEKYKEIIKLYKQKNKEKIKINSRESRRKYVRNRYKNDILFRLTMNARNRVRIALKQVIKSGSIIKDLGCPIEELKKHIESKFTFGMNWKNWGINGWHIDHIIPLCRFDLSNRNEYLKAINYKNLQPLWAKDNLKKGIT